jgi:hypothetical protein
MKKVNKAIKITALLVLIATKKYCISQCPDVTIEYNGETVSYCDGSLSEQQDFGIPCNPYLNYLTVSFYTDGSLFPIHIESQSNYVDFPTSPINVGHLGILESCTGELLFYSGAFACQVGWNYLQPQPTTNQIASQQYSVILDLPEGFYVAVIGFWAASNVFSIEGCIHYTFGNITFLNLDGQSQDDQISNYGYKEPSNKPMVRYRKMYTVEHGLVIADSLTGKKYSCLGVEIRNK